MLETIVVVFLAPPSIGILFVLAIVAGVRLGIDAATGEGVERG